MVCSLRPDKINESILCAGFGGQGIMVLGKVIANAGMDKGYNVTWMPSYGAEVRGGTAHSMVRISSANIASPIVVSPDTEFIMNELSLDKFEGSLKKDGTLILNSSLISRKVGRKDIKVIDVPFTDEAIKLGNVKVANMIALGVYVAEKGLFEKELLAGIFRKMAMGKKDLLSINTQALERGIEIGKS